MDPAVDDIATKIMVLLNQELQMSDRKIDDDIEFPDASLHVAKAAALEVLSRCNDQIILARHRQNSNARINQLPDEILGHIFQMCMDSDQDTSGTTYCKRRTILAAVSSSWREYIDLHPSFWTPCSQSTPLYILEAALLKSATCPLKIFAYQKRGDADEFWTVIAPHLSRCLFVKAFTGDILLEMLTQSVPVLEVLDLYGDRPHSNQPMLQLLLTDGHDHFPRVKELSLRRLSLPWTAPLSAKLVKLHLDCITDLPFNIMLEMLASSPRLNELKLENVNTPFLQPVKASASASVSLMELRVLDLGALDAQIIICLLLALHLPPLSNLRISPRRNGSSVFQALPSYVFDLVENIIRKALRYAISIYGTRFEINTEDEQCQLGPMGLDSLEWCLTRIREPSGLSPSVLIISGTSCPLLRAIFATDAFQFIEQVSIDCWTLPQFIDAISSPLNPGSWPLPNLDTISIEGNLLPTSGGEAWDWIAQRLKQHFASANTGQALSSLIYTADETEPITRSWLASVANVVPGCRVYRRAGGVLHEETGDMLNKKS